MNVKGVNAEYLIRFDQDQMTMLLAAIIMTGNTSMGARSAVRYADVVVSEVLSKEPS